MPIVGKPESLDSRERRFRAYAYTLGLTATKRGCGVGTCGKDGQSVPVGVGMPTIRIDDLTVGGTEG